ncbi:hypothetical protein BXZ70DRAFT_535849 [Cristinia sonorae]|uniref:RNA-dependent RNA polymerase n=1 Tax=Cristinia sonorae TaxID=1940300 RepID=A0A8K0UGY0_9AGAR|nr:hypothetical protein BXZ70DRAFT_535849 [Cristinia sonorae]
MAFADHPNYGPRSQQCLFLAKLASDAVDFPKSGIPVASIDIPVVKEYPDYMGKDYNSVRVFKKKPVKSYKSEKALGQMFRLIEEEPKFNQTSKEGWFDTRLRGFNVPEAYGNYLATAVLYKAQYEFELTGILRRYSISEAECVVGLLLRSPDTRLKVEKDYDLRVALREAYKELVSGEKERAQTFIEENPIEGDERDEQMWALAAYKVTYDQQYGRSLVDWSQLDRELGLPNEDSDEEEDNSEDDIPDSESCWSFPWIFHKALCALVRARS